MKRKTSVKINIRKHRLTHKTVGMTDRNINKNDTCHDGWKPDGWTLKTLEKMGKR